MKQQLSREVCLRSWLKKIEAVKDLLVDKAPDKKLDLDSLAAAYVYLQVCAPHLAHSVILSHS